MKNSENSKARMFPRERAIAALELRQPDKVPHFELEMQLTTEYFGKQFSTKQEWVTHPENKKEYLKHDAELLIETADRFDYCIIFYSGIYRPTAEDYIEGVKILKELDNNQRLIMAHGDPTMGIPGGKDIEDYAVRLFEEKDKILDDYSRKVDTALIRGKRLMDAGLDGFILCADYCLNTGPFLSPSMFGEYITPFLTKVVMGYRQMGAYVIKHTDGNIMPVIDQILSAKPHGLHSLDPMAGVDIQKVKSLYGKQVCLVGNVNCALMQTGTEDEILSSCKYAMENGKPGGGYIYSTSNVVFKGMPKRSYDLMLDYYQKNCQY
ncbi:MAG: uroporphyrinogen decarboxylase family protein [Elusimicrobiota bacterium]